MHMSVQNTSRYQDYIHYFIWPVSDGAILLQWECIFIRLLAPLRHNKSVLKASFDAETEIYNKLELLDNDHIPTSSDVITWYKKVLLEWTNKITLDPIILTIATRNRKIVCKHRPSRSFYALMSRTKL